MKNKNKKNKPIKCGRWLFLHPRWKKKKKKAGKPSPIKTIYKKFIFRLYRN